MTLPDETLQLSQEEQGRLLARVYAFILSDQFTEESKPATPKQKTHRILAVQPQEENQTEDASYSNPEPLA